MTTVLIDWQTLSLPAPTTIKLKHGYSVRFANVSWHDGTRKRTANICDVCDGKTAALPHVVTFAQRWVNLYA